MMFNVFILDESQEMNAITPTKTANRHTQCIFYSKYRTGLSNIAAYIIYSSRWPNRIRSLLCFCAKSVTMPGQGVMFKTQLHKYILFFYFQPIVVPIILSACSRRAYFANVSGYTAPLSVFAFMLMRVCGQSHRDCACVCICVGELGEMGFAYKWVHVNTCLSARMDAKRPNIAGLVIFVSIS